ncbi:MAG: hypothetical protein A2667_00355 [Candidatus Wildermuthbacteria bacterium RIFCSPHIGHO2_01_FULL_47_27]|uniref:Vitamin K epoxide reductase domain-containing protein n=2 Tax=Candidatus Wildermuthiibacteriota TaxID=1817923 RepID=A0A1G2RSM5_9BACT|nr:MAG: hypothetical protein UY15_C0035G0005 [Parcubacteria group bacterium GW2011_GWA2_47_9]OHA64476.1 MAG: hypothetical protein A2667_00355 [Candidatus Wildermuthbacteria bacterium RIFCSPHIGHO2_01_FULL_47_27]OHA68406.1 MAG: hypothetical protein A3D59_04545 [Candidatus Wildermuthbacteria bacterium RIFCSPHIGHO2_02_FULL_47_17]OHA75854.1 MAG: hypothetical protein A3A32_01785 [Candidatus Wildermuthbacteria bacterium RIFCSPLOWO2_01_FULL_48_35]OHA76388.1 MAG: hypothetical protein A3I38_01415 [Candid
MTPHALLFTIAAIGISETSYLIQKRRAGVRPVCVIGEDCAKVLESKYNSLLGIPNDVLGFLFYAAVIVLNGSLVIDGALVRPWLQVIEIFLKIVILGGMGMSLSLFYLQWRVIKAWCFWCLMSAITTFLMGFIVLITNLAIF